MTTWVLLRGLARDSRHWEGFPALLQSAGSADTQVIALDLPGNGSRVGEASPSTVGAMVDAYRATLRQHTGLHLLGLSLGAMVAAEWAARYPQEVASAVLVNGSAAGLSSLFERLRPCATGQLLASTLEHRPFDRERRVIAACTNLAEPELAAQRWALHAARGMTSVANVLRQVRAAASWRLPVARPEVPMLVIASAADRLVSVECSIAIARCWGLPLALHPTAGHEIAMDDPAWLVRQCTRWCHTTFTDVMEPTRSRNARVIAAAQTPQNVPR